MADEYISKQAFNDAIREAVRKYPNTFYNGLEVARQIAHDMDAADVAPVRHGRWQITECYPHNVYCSECHARCAQTHWAVWDDGSLPRAYCPNCGAKMDGGEVENGV